MLNDLYTIEWNLCFNFFNPSMKLIDKQRVGSKIIKKYNAPKTPFQRLLESEHVENETKQRLNAKFLSLNPVKLQRRMKQKIDTIINFVNRT